jgi:hypothetical protein
MRGMSGAITDADPTLAVRERLVTTAIVARET